MDKITPFFIGGSVKCTAIDGTLTCFTYKGDKAVRLSYVYIINFADAANTHYFSFIRNSVEYRFAGLSQTSLTVGAGIVIDVIMLPGDIVKINHTACVVGNFINYSIYGEVIDAEII